MSRVSIAAPHLSVEAVKEKIKSARSFWQRQKWLVVYNALLDPRDAAEIAKHIGVSVGTVYKVQALMTLHSENIGKSVPQTKGRNIGLKTANTKPLPNSKTGNAPDVVTTYSTENQLKPII